MLKSPAFWFIMDLAKITINSKGKGSKNESNKNASQSHADIHVTSKIDNFFARFKPGTLLYRYGIRKHYGNAIRSLIETIFTLPFVGKNFLLGIVTNEALAFSKSAW